MMARSNAIYAAALSCLLAGCADGSLNSFTTGSINPQQQELAAGENAEKSKQALCNTLVTQIEALNSEGVSDKVAKAAAKKYKLKAADLTKADELNKANTEFQAKCTSYPPRVATAAPVEAVATAAVAQGSPAATAGKAAAKAPVNGQKPVAAALVPQTTPPATAGAADGGASFPTP